jgi:hypothetical protein
MNPVLLDAHDRLNYISRQADAISEECQKIIDNPQIMGKPVIGVKSYYIFAHARTTDGGINKRLLWQVRLTRPEPQENSMLFKVYTENKETLKVIWNIPDRSMWNNYKKGKLIEQEEVIISIDNYLHNKELLGSPDPDDMSDEEVRRYYLSLLQA